METNVRYWERVGMYVTKQFAEEWIEKLGADADGRVGKYLDDEIEEYTASPMISTFTLRDEIEKLFGEDYKEIELPPETQAIIAVSDMEKNRVSRIRELKSDGYSLEEAKAQVTSEINQAVAVIMGIDLEKFEIMEEERYAQAGRGAEATEASVNDGEE